jgi:hypothetical protein
VNSSKYPCFFRCVDRDIWGVEASLHTQHLERLRYLRGGYVYSRGYVYCSC